MPYRLPIALLVLWCSSCSAQHMNAPGNPCQNAGADAEMSACFAKAAAAADRKLNVTYERLQKGLDPDSFNELRAAQRIWLQFRDSNCNAESNLYKGGSAAPMVYSACLESVTRQREQDLHVMYDWILEK
jgi:uncharacterized protein YecT (DUF1311 family)